MTKAILYVLDKPKEYYTAIKDIGFVKVDAVPIKLKELPGVDLFFHSEHNGFDKVVKKGLMLLKKWNRGDYSPRYRKEGGK